ncbi:MAG: PemK family protein [Pseudanabaena sp.]|nr:MAG: PemK family protein [Pseudanabaena sp.]
MKSGDIVLVRFPQADLKAGKLRPALVVAIAPSRHPDLLLALISSRIHQAIPNFDDIIDTSDDDYLVTGLKITSVIRLSRLATLESSIISARLGNISLDRLKRIKTRLIDWIST